MLVKNSLMVTPTDYAAIFNYHQDMIKMHGRESSYALGWRDRKSQQLRFNALADIADVSNCSILDAGCGYGDLLPYLSANCDNFRYTGIEQIPALLNEAIKRHGNFTNARFLPGNFVTMELPAADYVFASGSLNYRSVDTGFIYRIITKLYAACRIGFAFNLLSNITPNGLIVAHNPEEIIHFCSSICPTVKLISGYDPDDFTVYMYK